MSNIVMDLFDSCQTQLEKVVTILLNEAGENNVSREQRKKITMAVHRLMTSMDIIKKEMDTRKARRASYRCGYCNKNCHNARSCEHRKQQMNNSHGNNTL